MLHSTAVVSLACTFFSLRLCIHCTGSLLFSCFDFLFDVQRGVWVGFFFCFTTRYMVWGWLFVRFGPVRSFAFACLVSFPSFLPFCSV